MEFEKNLSQTMHGSPMNMSISGNRGTGKTSILIKFENIAKNNNCLTLRISNYEGNLKNILELTNYISSNLKRELLSRRSVELKQKLEQEWTETLTPYIVWRESAPVKEQEDIVQDLLRDRLLKLWDEIKTEYCACVILFDEAESLERDNLVGALTFLREVFQRISTDSNYMVVLAGKLNFPDQMSESFSPLNRFFPCFRLKPFSKDEIRQYLVKKLDSVNVGIDEDAITYIAEKSEGHPYVLVAMSYLIFDSMNDDEDHISMDLIIRSRPKIKSRLAEDFFKPMYHPLTPKAKEIITLIAIKSPSQDFSFAQSLEYTHKSKNIMSPYIQELLRKGVIDKLERGKYQIFHSLFREFLIDNKNPR